MPILVFAVVGVGAAVLATGAFIYQKATEPDRSTPTASLQQMLTAMFVADDPAQISLFLCSDWTAEEATDSVKGQMDPTAKVSWGSMATVDLSDKRATVEVRMLFRYPEDVTPSGERYWTFEAVNDGGWRVCGGHPKS